MLWYQVPTYFGKLIIEDTMGTMGVLKEVNAKRGRKADERDLEIISFSHFVISMINKN